MRGLPTKTESEFWSFYRPQGRGLTRRPGITRKRRQRRESCQKEGFGVAGLSQTQTKNPLRCGSERVWMGIFLGKVSEIAGL